MDWMLAYFLAQNGISASQHRASELSRAERTMWTSWAVLVSFCLLIKPSLSSQKYLAWA